MPTRRKRRSDGRAPDRLDDGSGILFDEVELETPAHIEREIDDREIRRMTLETSSNLYAQRRNQW